MTQEKGHEVQAQVPGSTFLKACYVSPEFAARHRSSLSGGGTQLWRRRVCVGRGNVKDFFYETVIHSVQTNLNDTFFGYSWRMGMELGALLSLLLLSGGPFVRWTLTLTQKGVQVVSL